MSLFESMVAPVLQRFGGIYDYKEIDKLYNRLCKSILGFDQQTPNTDVYDKLRRYQLSVMCKKTVLKYWLKIRNNDNSIMYNIMY